MVKELTTAAGLPRQENTGNVRQSTLQKLDRLKQRKGDEKPANRYTPAKAFEVLLFVNVDVFPILREYISTTNRNLHLLGPEHPDRGEDDFSDGRIQITPKGLCIDYASKGGVYLTRKEVLTSNLLHILWDNKIAQKSIKELSQMSNEKLIDKVQSAVKKE